jgi:hypothetical protein
MKPDVTDPLPIGTQINRRKEEIQAAHCLTDGGNNKYSLSFTCRSHDIYPAMYPRHASVFCWIPNVRKFVQEGIRESFNF